MTQSAIKRIDIGEILARKAPSVAGKIPRFVVNYLARTIHQEEINDILSRYHDKEGVAFMQELVHYFDLTLELVNEHHLPPSGKRCLFVSNHPLGGLDGICLAATIGARYKEGIRYLVNDLLMNLPNLKSIFVPINKYGTQGKEAARLIEGAYASNHQIITFPAGLCSRKEKGVVRDPEWRKSFIQKAVEYERDVVPVFFEAENSSFFYRIAQLRKRLGIKMNYELIYLPDEMFRCKHKRFRIHLGEPIAWQTFDNSRKPAEWARWVMEQTYYLTDK